MLDASYTQNRELSWLRFNERVLEEAADPAVPLLERLKFLAIFTSNLDEFFMIRVGSLYELSLLKNEKFDNKSFLKPSEQLTSIFAAVRCLIRRRDQESARLENALREEHITHLVPHRLAIPDKSFLKNLFRENLYPILSPQIIDLRHPFPHLVNKQLYIAVLLKHHKKTTLGIIPVPPAVPRLIRLPGEGLRYVLSEDLLLDRAGDIFSMYAIIDKAIISVTRNADISPDDEAPEVGEDYLQHMKATLKKRRQLAPVRLELQTEGDSLLVEYLRKRLKIKKEQVYRSETPLDLKFAFDLPGLLPAAQAQLLQYPPFTPVIPAAFRNQRHCLDYLARHDCLFFYPYESFDAFLHIIHDAATDPSVLSLHITIYRLGRQRAQLINYLCLAAENGKDVTVLMELKARFDEESNILWSQSLEDAGCHILYGFEGYKVHSKICLITRRVQGHIQFITQIGTGNYNARTATQYTDLSLITADPEIGHDADRFFKDMGLGNLNGTYTRLLAAPSSLKPALLRLIAAEAAKAQRGDPASITLKMNALTDRQLIDALQTASIAGVKIELIIRSICCLLPGIPGKTENIHVRSIVGRFLEHSRIFCFGCGSDLKIYLSSADWMTRNTENRVEIACPVLDDALRTRLLNILDILLADNVKARELQSDGTGCPFPATAARLDSQQYFLTEAVRQQAR